MATKSILVLFAAICLFKITLAQCIGAINSITGTALAAEEHALGANMAYNAGLGAFGAAPLGYGAMNFGAGYGHSITPSNGGGFAVTSMSPISPTGITVVSENAIEGPLSITGQLPFLGAIAVEGALPTAGTGAINYGCGNGAVGIVSEGLAPTMGPAAYPTGPGPFPGGPGAYPAGPAVNAAGLSYPGVAGPRPLNGLGQGAGLGYRGVY